VEKSQLAASLNMANQVSHPYKEIGNNAVFFFWSTNWKAENLAPDG
jgi:hypothetical protein